MSRKLSKFKIQRRLSITLPGFGNKKAKGPMEKRPTTPGMHGGQYGRKVSEYGLRLKEKQKIRFHYQIRERQLLNYIKKSKKIDSNWIVPFAEMVETRLDNMVFRLGFFPTIASARQAVTHGHVQINGKKCSYPSCLVKVGDKVSLKESTYKNFLVEKTRKEPTLELPAFLAFEKGEGGHDNGYIVEPPKDTDIPFEFNQQYFIEFYGYVK